MIGGENQIDAIKGGLNERSRLVHDRERQAGGERVQRRAAAAENLANGNHHKSRQDIGKSSCHIQVVEDTAKRSLQIVTMLDDCGSRMGATSPPKAGQVADESSGIVLYQGAFIHNGWQGLADEGIDAHGSVRTLRAIRATNTDPPLALADDPLQRVEKEARDKKNEYARNMYVKRALFFFGEFFSTSSTLLATAGWLS
jgi:hypothetical protein